MGWVPEFGKLFMSGIIVIVGIRMVPAFPAIAGAVIGGGLIYAIKAGTGVFLGNIPSAMFPNPAQSRINAAQENLLLYRAKKLQWDMSKKKGK